MRVYACVCVMGGCGGDAAADDGGCGGGGGVRVCVGWVGGWVGGGGGRYGDGVDFTRAPSFLPLPLLR